MLQSYGHASRWSQKQSTCPGARPAPVQSCSLKRPHAVAFMVHTPWLEGCKCRSVETMVYPPEPADMTDRPPKFTVSNMRRRFLPVSHDARTFLNRPVSIPCCLL